MDLGASNERSWGMRQPCLHLVRSIFPIQSHPSLLKRARGSFGSIPDRLQNLVPKLTSPPPPPIFLCTLRVRPTLPRRDVAFPWHARPLLAYQDAKPANEYAEEAVTLMEAAEKLFEDLDDLGTGVKDRCLIRIPQLQQCARLACALLSASVCGSETSGYLSRNVLRKASLDTAPLLSTQLVSTGSESDVLLAKHISDGVIENVTVEFCPGGWRRDFNFCVISPPY